MKKGIIFDMDGTLWDSAQNVAKSWDAVVQKKDYVNRRITTEDIQSVMGKTMDKIAEILFPELPLEKRTELLKECCQDENAYLREHGGVLYPNLRSTILKLKENYHIYIVSNCQSGYIEAFLDYYDFWDLVEDIECYGNNNQQKAENIALVVKRNHLDDAVYVGDIQGDYDATMKAGIKFIHAAYGFGTINTETVRIESFEELPKVILDSKIL